MGHKGCEIAGCRRPLDRSSARGLCSAHYQQMRRRMLGRRKRAPAGALGVKLNLRLVPLARALSEELADRLGIAHAAFFRAAIDSALVDYKKRYGNEWVDIVSAASKRMQTWEVETDDE